VAPRRALDNAKRLMVRFVHQRGASRLDITLDRILDLTGEHCCYCGHARHDHYGNSTELGFVAYWACERCASEIATKQVVCYMRPGETDN